jgi:hypothetical protein
MVKQTSRCTCFDKKRKLIPFYEWLGKRTLAYGLVENPMTHYRTDTLVCELCGWKVRA